MRARVAIGMALLLLVAGCLGGQAPPGTTTAAKTTTTTAETTGGTATGTRSTTTAGTTIERTTTAGSATTTRDPNPDGPNLGIDVLNGDLPYDPNTTYARVQDILGTNVSPPSAVTVVDPDAGGSTSGSGQVYIKSKDESVLAHEFAHSILLRAYDVPSSGSPDEQFAHHAAIEGAAEYVQGVYERRYLDRGPYGWSLSEDPGRSYHLARYAFGVRYYRARVDSATEIPALHHHPPNTSEQVLHGLAPGSEPPADLPVTVPTRHLARDAPWHYDGRRRLGEIGVRWTLRTRLPDDHAAAGADGWGNDRIVAFTHDGTTNFAWVIRWDDAENASEFADAFAAFRNASPPRYAAPSDPQETPYRAFTDRVWAAPSPAMDLRRVDDRTTVVAFGSPEFVQSVTVEEGDDGVLTVGVED